MAKIYSSCNDKSCFDKQKKNLQNSDKLSSGVLETKLSDAETEGPLEGERRSKNSMFFSHTKLLTL